MVSNSRDGNDLLIIQHMKHAPFFSLDGIDGAGKSTQCRLLAEWLRQQGYPVVECADPGCTQIGATLRTLLLEHRGHMSVACEALLFMASRAQLIAEIIRPALEAGTIVVSDRFFLANVVYQGYGGGLDPARLFDLALFTAGGLEPDVTFVLDLPPSSAVTRRKMQPDRLESREASYHEKVCAGFRTEARRRPDRVILVDATRSVDPIQADIRAEVSRVLGANPRS